MNRRGVSTVNIIGGEILKAFPSNITNKTNMPVFTTATEHFTVLPRAIRQEKKKVSLFTDEIILYTENPNANKINSAK